MEGSGVKGEEKMGDLLVSAYREGGLILLLVIVLVLITFLLFKHILGQSDGIMKMGMSMNEKWQKVIDDMTSQSREFQNQVRDAHNYQREEHKEQIKVLNQIDTNAQARGRALEKICGNLEEQGKVLTRINGEKHS